MYDIHTQHTHIAMVIQIQIKYLAIISSGISYKHMFSPMVKSIHMHISYFG